MNGTGVPVPSARKIAVADAAGTELAHDITEIRPGEFRGPAFRKGHIVCDGDICHLRRLGKEHLWVLGPEGEMVHEDEAAVALARALMGDGVALNGGTREGKVGIVAGRAGLLKIDRAALLAFNLPGDIACSTLHDNTVVGRGQLVAETRAIPLLIPRNRIREAEAIGAAGPVISVLPLRQPRAGILVTGNEVFSGLIEDRFAGIITGKLAAYGGTVTGIRYAPDDESAIGRELADLLAAGSDLLVVTGGMSVDPDDVTRFAIRNLGAEDTVYGSAVSPGAMFLAAWLDPGDGRPRVPVLGVPACALHAPVTVFDLVLPRILAGERIGREDLAALGHGGLCMRCGTCRFPACPFGR